MPCSAMQKLSVRNGCMLRCAWLPPMFATDAGIHRYQILRAVGTRFGAVLRQQVLSGVDWLRRIVVGVRLRDVGVGRQLGDGERVGRLAASLAQRVPAADVNRRPRPQSGSAKLTRPSPPNVVPSSENSAWF